MAKQSGIHQLRGKVGEMSYYRQAGVEPGLVRKINQGMSARVKTADEFANTRLNNSEFKNANFFATWAYHAVRPSWRAMFRRFAMAGMTKRILEAMKSGTGNWGHRQPSSSFGPILEDALVNYAKLGEYHDEYGVITYEDIAVGEQEEYLSTRLTLDLSASTQELLKNEGIDGFDMISSSLFCSQGNKNYAGIGIADIRDIEFGSPATDISINFDDEDPSGMYYHIPLSDWVQAESQRSAGVVLITVICPYRTINGIKHTLQEKCTFVCHGHDIRSN